MGIFDSLMASNLRDDEEDSPKVKVDTVINRIKDAKYNVNEMESIIRNDARYQLVESVAGSGKTTTLNFKVLSDIYSGRAWGKKVWVNTFLKTGSESLKQDFYNKVRQLKINVPLSNITFGTMHSEFYRVLSSIGLRLDIISPVQDRVYKNKASAEYLIGNKPGYLTNVELKIFETLETYINSCAVEPADDVLVSLGIEELGTEPKILKKACKDLYKRRLKSELYSFDDMQRILYHYLVEEPQPNLINLIRNRYKYIYIDEFQDTSRIQYEILKFYCQNAEQVLFVGDSDQSIYSWRGANIDIITKNVIEDYHTDIKHLSVNYRVPEKILTPIARSIVHNEKRLQKKIVAAKQGGEIELDKFETKNELIRFMVDSIYEESNNFNDIAVLSSTNAGITDLAIMLLLQRKKKVNFRIGGTLVDLNRKVYRQFWLLAHMFSPTKPNEHLTANLLTLTHGEISRWKAKKVEEMCRNMGINILELNPDVVYQYTQSRELVNVVKEVQGYGQLEGLYLMFEHLVKYYNNEAEKSVNPSFFQSLNTKIRLMQSLLKFSTEIKTISQFLQEIDRINMCLKDAYENRSASIILTTPFDFKGKEADLVYIYEDTKYNFPRSKSADIQFEEERRLHYIAGTRARQKCIYTTITSEISPFLLEMHIDDGQSDS